MSDDALKPGEVEQHGGGTIVFDATLRKHAIYDGNGHLHGFRGSLERARELALAIPVVSWTPAPPPEPSRSPDAMQLPPPHGVPPSVPRDQRGSALPGGDGRSAWRRRSGLPSSGPAPRVILRKPRR
jgi:hypothetical protein